MKNLKKKKRCLGKNEDYQGIKGWCEGCKLLDECILTAEETEAKKERIEEEKERRRNLTIRCCWCGTTVKKLSATHVTCSDCLPDYRRHRAEKYRLRIKNEKIRKELSKAS